MLKNCPFYLPFFWILPYVLQAQQVPELAGARGAALGMGGVVLEDVWAVQNNIGALGSLEDPTIAFAYNTRLQLKELTTFGAVVGIPIKNGVAAASFTRYGKGAYHLTTTGMGYSHKIRLVSIGIKFSYLQQVIEDYISQGTMVMEAGGKAEILPKLNFAAHTFNLTQSSFKSSGKQLVPVILTAGLEYLPSETILIILQTSKEVDYPARLTTAIEYQLLDELQIRTGIRTNPLVASFGIGFRQGKFGFDYAFRHHNTIGAAHHLAISIAFISEENP